MTKSLLLLSLIFVSKAYAVESPSQPSKQPQKIELQTTISGAEEEPKFMSILPWQDLEKVQLTKPQLRLLPRHKISAIDPSKLKRQIAFHQSQNKNNNPN